MSDARTSIEARAPAPFAYHTNDQVHQSLSTRPIQKSSQSAFVQWRRIRTVSASEEYQIISHPAIEEHWYDWIVELFKKPSPEKLGHRELEDARRNLLECQRLREYYDNMVKFETQRIKRLRKMLEVDESALT